MPARTTLFLSNRSQAVRIPRAFTDHVREVTILQDGPRRIIVPCNSVWDDFFDAPGVDPSVDLGDRQQPQAQRRDSL